MRLKIDTLNLREIRSLDFVPAGEHNGDITLPHLYIYIDGEPIGHVNLDEFQNYESAENWVRSVTNQCMINGYWDITMDSNKVVIYGQ